MQFDRPKRVAQLSLALSLGFGTFLAACTATVNDGASPASGGSSGTPGPTAGTGGGITNPATCQPGIEPHRAPQRVVLLSELEQVNAIQDLLGTEALAADVTLPTDRGRTLDLDLVNQVSDSSLDAYDKRISAVAQNVKTRAAALTQCATGTAPDACATQYATKLAERAFRRPVTDVELTELMAVYTAGAAISHDDGIAYLTQAILFAPSMMYRRELGTPNGQVATLSSWEIADQLAHFLYSSIPDDGLVSAAKADSLTNDAGIRLELDRLLATDRVKQSLSQTVLAWLETAKLAQKQKDAKYADYAALQASMYTETSTFIDNFLWAQPASIGELLTSTRTFVDPGLAAFYGVPYPGAPGSTAFMPVDLPADQRAGILTQASHLSIKAGPDNTSVIFRGLFMHDRVLCLPEIPGPPQDEKTQMQIAQQQMGGETELEKATYRKTTSPCSSCHAQFDLFGLALENFDGIGRYRTMNEKGVAIDASIDLSTFKDYGLDGTVSGIVALAQQVKASGQFTTCLSSQIMTYAANHVLHADDCGVQAVGQSLTPGSDTFTDMVRGIALSPTFRTRSVTGAMQ